MQDRCFLDKCPLLRRNCVTRIWLRNATANRCEYAQNIPLHFRKRDLMPEMKVAIRSQTPLNQASPTI